MSTNLERTDTLVGVCLVYCVILSVALSRTRLRPITGVEYLHGPIIVLVLLQRVFFRLFALMSHMMASVFPWSAHGQPFLKPNCM